ncbi:hypothetical protein BGZ57DRAFT_892043 [Hyaloscypha finlandica]|nr:hypothetical protein F5882DRAFT_415370 [Hyaloscypha sp. PMI_1271]KAH8776150.1 hypothetical protein BGZ57DRAFT_892043 [Hyaloscypha finlandica]
MLARRRILPLLLPLSLHLYTRHLMFIPPHSPIFEKRMLIDAIWTSAADFSPEFTGADEDPSLSFVIWHRIRTSRGRWRRKQGLLWDYGGG